MPVASPKFWKHLAEALLVALVIETLLHYVLDEHPWLVELEQRSLDWAMALHRLDAPVRTRPTPFVFVDVDDASYHAWGGPRSLPRDKIAAVIATLSRLEPALLVVDIDLASAEQSAAGGLHAGDQMIRDVLARQVGELPIILARVPTRVDGVAVLEPSYLDAVVDTRDSIVWASTLFQRDVDWTIRRWKLWETVRRGDADGEATEVLPAIQLLAAALRYEGETGLAQLHERISGLIANMPAASAIPLGGIELSLPPSETNQRVFYRYPARHTFVEGEAYPTHPGSGLQMLNVIAAHTLVQPPEKMSRELFRGKIIVLGGSYAGGKDLHRTPLGEMAGALIVINAIDSLLEYGELRQAHPIVVYATLVIVVIGVSMLFALCNSVRAAYLAVLALIVTLLPLSVYLLKHGYWLDYALALTGVMLHKLFAEAGYLRKSRTP